MFLNLVEFTSIAYLGYQKLGYSYSYGAVKILAKFEKEVFKLASVNLFVFELNHEISFYFCCRINLNCRR